MTHQTPWLESTDFMCNKTEIVSMLLKTGPNACVAGELSLLMVCRQACDASTSSE